MSHFQTWVILLHDGYEHEADDLALRLSRESAERGESCVWESHYGVVVGRADRGWINVAPDTLRAISGFAMRCHEGAAWEVVKGPPPLMPASALARHHSARREGAAGARAIPLGGLKILRRSLEYREGMTLEMACRKIDALIAQLERGDADE